MASWQKSSATGCKASPSNCGQRADLDLAPVLIKGNRGRIHSRYNSTTNLIDVQARWWALVNPQLGVVPRGLTLAQPINHEALSNAEWFIDELGLRLGEYFFPLDGIRYADLIVSSEPINSSAYNMAKNLISEQAPKQIDDFARIANEMAQDRFRQLVRSAPSKEVLERAVDSLVGLGSGLTPVGDDLLCGLALAAHTPGSLWHQRRTELFEAIQNHFSQTHPLSAQYLQDACSGKARSCVLEFRKNLSKPTSTLTSSLKQVWNLGGSSGPALLEGLLAGLNPNP